MLRIETLIYHKIKKIAIIVIRIIIIKIIIINSTIT